MTYYQHHVPGRLRVRKPALKGNALAAQSVRQQLAQIPGVHSVEVSAITGSILMHYDKRPATAEALLQLLGRPVKMAAVHPPVARRAKRFRFAPVARAAAPWVAEKLFDFALEKAFFAIVAAVV